MAARPAAHPTTSRAAMRCLLLATESERCDVMSGGSWSVYLFQPHGQHAAKHVVTIDEVMFERRRDVQQRQPKHCSRHELMSVMKQLVSRPVRRDQIRQRHQTEPAHGKVPGG